MLSKNEPLDASNPDLNCDLFEYANALGFGDIHIKTDAATGLKAIIAIHSTKLGPSLGGCRCREYPSEKAAFWDAMRLAQGMSYKAAITDLPLGGGKSVLLKPKQIKDRPAYFKAFGRFIAELNGRYITAMDSGTNPADMDAIATETNYVTSTSAGNGDPSPYTAQGVALAIQAAAEYKLSKNSLEGLHIAIQGVGNVGHFLIESLHQQGVKLTLSDINTDLLQHVATKYQANTVPPDAIYDVDCDIFAPCALGAILNDTTIPRLKASIVVGSANNQLAASRHGVSLQQRDILYGPDYVVNAGGLIYACAQFYKTSKDIVSTQVQNIYKTTLNVFERAAKEKLATNLVADKIAQERL